MRMLKLHPVRMFDVAAKRLNFRQAADELNLTQGAVAQAVRGLEADLNVTLFKRLPRGLALTELGRHYHSEISKGLAIIDKATIGLHSNANTVTVSVPPSFASKWLVPRLPYFAEEHPEIEVRTIASEAVTDFQTQDVDIAVRLGKRPLEHNLAVELLTFQDLCVLCSPERGGDLGEFETIEVFTRHPLIQDGHRYWETLFRSVSIDSPDQFLQFNQTALAMDAAANGQGFTVAPKTLANGELSSGRLIEVWRDYRETEIGYWLVHPLIDRPNHEARSLLKAWFISECE